LSYSQPGTNAIGNWVLDSLQRSDSLIIASSKIYQVTISPNSIQYQFGANICDAEIKLTSDSIHYEGVACTEICCNETGGNMYPYINYRGKYKVHNSNRLTIENQTGIFYLSRSNIR